MGDVAVVTGAASGLGRAVALRLAASGASVAVVDRDLAGAEATAADVTASGGRAAAFACDVADWSSVEAAIAEVTSRLGPPTRLCNAAAVQRFSRTHLLDPADFARILAVNLTGTFHVCRAVLPAMIAAGRGAIVNIASTAGITGLPYDAAYCAAKGGVVQLTKALAVEYAPKGIRVNAVAPGGMQTPMLHVPFPDDAEPEVMATIRRSRLGVGAPDDVASVVCFVLSDEARYMTGAIVVADGGATA